MSDLPNASKRPRTGSVSIVSGPRVTQRLPLSCTECSRRKIKCDRSIPCRQCLDRGEDLSCRREEVAIRGEIKNNELEGSKRKTFDELQVQVEELSRRVTDLERGAGSSRPRERRTAPRDGSPSVIDKTRLPGVMEEAALGIGETSRWKEPITQQPRQWERSYTPWFSCKTVDDCLLALPSQAQARSLVHFYIDQLAWITGSLDIPTLVRDQETFWIQQEAHQVRDDMWLSLYLAVISVSAFFVEAERATSMNCSMEQLRHLGQQCFDAAIATVFRCDGATRASIVLCQAVQTLGPSFHFTSNTMLHRTLVAIVAGHARSLNLHLLGELGDTTGENVGRHVWWNLVEPDWAFLPYNRYCTIYAHQFTSGLPQSDDRFPPYRTVCFRAAKVLFDLFGELSTIQDPSYEAVTAASRSLHIIRDEYHASEYRLSKPDGQRYLIDMTLAYREYQCHRMFFVRAMTDPRYTQSYTACINAATVISSISSHHLSKSFLVLWNVTVMVVAAGIILALDHALKPRYTDSSRRLDDPTTVYGLVDTLRQLQDPSGIASRGVTLIEHLLRIESNETITRDAIRQLVTASRNPQASADLWQQQPSAPRMYAQSSFPFDQSAAMSSGIDQGQGVSWAEMIGDDAPYPTDLDLDFARLLGQIMPNAG